MVAHNYPLRELTRLLERNRKAESVGVFSVCSANPFVLKTAIQCALETGGLLIIESTSNQVNQFGGYTSMKPADFSAYVSNLAQELGLPSAQVCLGADHAGPNPWQHENSHVAMGKAKTLIRDSVLAGYQKIHLDASMRCADDDPNLPLPPDISADRASQLCEAAEAATTSANENLTPPVYIIGTEVPIPGGTQDPNESPRVTTVDAARQTLELTKEAFLRRGLEDAWNRVVAMVVQPGVEFGDQLVHTFDPANTTGLSRFIEIETKLVFEAHSTDYQSRSALKQLVASHFAILKVGPALTFAFREALFALAHVEKEIALLHSDIRESQLLKVLEETMLAQPEHWKHHYRGSNPEQALARKYSLSDRSRYYWDTAGLQTAIDQLIHNLEKSSVPLGLVSQYLPAQFVKIQEDRLDKNPTSWIADKISVVLDDYVFACSLP